MSNLKLNLPDEPTYEAWANHVANVLPKSGKVGHNTYASNWDYDNLPTPDDYMGVWYHSTCIVKMFRDGTIKLNSGGWRTSTTKNRLGLILRPWFTVMQKDYEWFVMGRSDKDGEYWDKENMVRFEDGMVIQRHATALHAEV